MSGRLGHIEVRRRTATPDDGVDSPVHDEPVRAQFLDDRDTVALLNLVSSMSLFRVNGAWERSTSRTLALL